ncbi:GNAT family N-acetyltransferase [Cytobacillus spongiae]|uniref:GNAT family N-acetyltransferase n=1 Tax=Cytobacillus spongiae TaxID=2901381 RepID=UPI001F26F4F5|nr:GNAT family N-acetyltransferase [Cytobacillus spongiae]UII56278.1 GNAT family N-acetyltransferase [Cytobacillus spongiae]
MGIKLATEDDIQWVNEQYQEIGFVSSDLTNEIIAIVTYQNKYAGVGRIVFLNEKEAEIGGIYILEEYRGLSLATELVAYLVKKAKTCELKEVYCLPFEELRHFYEKFGFKEKDSNKEYVHEAILNKHNWCLANYDKKVLLFSLQ